MARKTSNKQYISSQISKNYSRIFYVVQTLSCWSWWFAKFDQLQFTVSQTIHKRVLQLKVASCIPYVIVFCHFNLPLWNSSFHFGQILWHRHLMRLSLFCSFVLVSMSKPLIVSFPHSHNADFHTTSTAFQLYCLYRFVNLSLKILL